MKKTTAGLISLLIALSVFGTATAFAFSDVPDAHENAEAIDYLYKQGVIQGYGDGTFKPNAKVNRAEFLKIILEGSNIKLDITAKTEFPDVDENAWYTPYIRKAKKEGWVQGYPDGTFRPESYINKVEALKILGKVQEWETGEKAKAAPFQDVAALAWYAPYVEYAKKHDFLEEKGDYFQPDVPMSRAKISEVIYRTMIFEEAAEGTAEGAAGKTEAKTAEESESEEFEEDVGTDAPEGEISGPEEEIEEINFVPVPAKTYGADFFDNILLTDSFPNIFYKNEIYTLKGKILQGDYSTIFVFLSYADGNKDNINFPADIENGNFEIQMEFRETGNFKMGIIPGEKGTSKVADTSVLPDLPAPSPEIKQDAEKADSLDVVFSDDKTTFYWENGGDITKILIYQKDIVKTYIFRQEREALAVDFEDFEGFEEGAAYFKVKTARMLPSAPLTISSDWKESGVKEIQITEHKFSEINDDKITYSAIPEILIIPQKVQFTGTAKEELMREAAIITPAGTVEKIGMSSASEFGDYHGNETIKKGAKYTFEYTPPAKGTYILEINEAIGYAAINKPLYIGGEIPLIPDFFDTYEEPPLTPGAIDTQKAHSEILDLINETRVKMGLGEVTLSDELNILAQNHSEDMIKNNFFAHVNLKGETPDDRRKAAGITTEVGENLAKSVSIIYAHEGLMRSAIHRQNIINEKWTRVGIGVKKDSEGYYIITEEFSEKPFTDADMAGLEQEVINYINEKRSMAGAAETAADQTLKNIAELWSTKMAEQEFLGFEAPDSEKLEEIINQSGLTTQVQVFVVQGTEIGAIKEKIIKDTEITDPGWKKLGVSIKLQNDGALKLTMLYTP